MNIELVTVKDCNCGIRPVMCASNKEAALDIFKKFLGVTRYWMLHYNNEHVVNIFVDGESIRPLVGR